MLIKDNTYITIQSFMVKDLKLKGNELLIYAIIFGYSQDDESCFNGSIKYLADWTNSTKRSVMNNLKALVDKELILKQESYSNNLKFCQYKANLEYELGGEKFSPVGKKDELGGEKSSLGVVKNFPLGGEKSSPNNIYNNNSNNTIKNNIRANFKKPTVEEIQAYCLERKNTVNAELFFDHYESKGWMIGRYKMKDWKAAVRTWERNSFNQPSQNNSKIYGKGKEQEYLDSIGEW